MVTAPVRSSPGFGATNRRTVVLPDPSDGPALLIHAVSLRTCQLQPAVAARSTLSSPPLASKSTALGATSYRQGTAACRISTSPPPTATVPRRTVPAGF